MEMRDIKLFFRDRYNDLVGKTPLIRKYYDITYSICCYTDRMPISDTKKQILTALDKMQEDQTAVNVNKDTNSLTIGGDYNPYNSCKAKLCSKIAYGLNIMKEYNIQMQKTCY